MKTNNPYSDLLQPNPFLFKGGKCLKTHGNPWAPGQDGSRGQSVMVGPASSNPSTWYLEMANNTDFYIRLATDSDQALCISYGKKEENQPCHLWYNFNHREWAQKWVININQTLSPVGGKHLALGTKADGSSLILVPLDSLNCVYLERSEDAMKLVKAELTLKAAYNLEKFGQYITQNNLKDLAEKGHVKLNGLVPIEMVKKALREINKQLGQSDESPKIFKGKKNLNSHCITGLFNDTVLPYLMLYLLGPLKSGEYRQGGAQIALRFPGDLCPNEDPGSFNSDVPKYQRQWWHIDGLASEPPNDHFGKIHNFDCLVGVLLQDVEENFSGELGVISGSHLKLGKFFKQEGMLERARIEGAKVLQQAKNDKILADDDELYHFTGKAGDVILVNYSCAHLINANASENIRYAVYFRVRGPSFEGKVENFESFVDPLMNWNLKF